MSVRYGSIKLQVPPGFKTLLEHLAREVLREQPKDIPEFAAAYFNRLLQRRAGMKAFLTFMTSFIGMWCFKMVTQTRI